MIILIAVGRFFYKLANIYKKSKWGYAILVLVVCYGIFFAVALVYALIYYFFNPLALDDDLNDWTLTIISILFALIKGSSIDTVNPQILGALKR